MKFKFTLILLFTMSLTACAVTEPEREMLTVEKEACCQKFNDFPYLQLEDSEKLEFTINEKSSVAIFDNNKSYFTAFKFSERSGEVILYIDSLMLKKEVFAPTVLLLNENFEIAKTINLNEFEEKVSSMFTSTSFSKKLKVNTEITPYFIIYTAQEDVGKTTTVPHPANVRAKKFGEPAQMVTDPSYLHALTGTIQLEVELKTLKATSAKMIEEKVAVSATKNTKMMSETEAMYNEMIIKAANKKDFDKALKLVEEAEKAGSKTARPTFLKILKK